MKDFWKHAPEVARRLGAGKLLLTLDFDGTLAALAETPRKARLKPEFRAALRGLAAMPGVEVFILSGRALRDLRRLVALPGLYYGGNHGAELAGPGFSRRHSAAAGRREVAELAADTAQRFPPGTGVLVEDKGFSASIHYRGLKAPYRTGFFRHIRALTAAAPPRLRWSRGHKVFEARLRGAPHKGDAAALLARRLRCRTALAVGDDLTDEDMFRALRPAGVTVRVGRRTASAAEYCLASQSEVLRLLRFAAAARREAA